MGAMDSTSTYRYRRSISRPSNVSSIPRVMRSGKSAAFSGLAISCSHSASGMPLGRLANSTARVVLFLPPARSPSGDLEGTTPSTPGPSSILSGAEGGEGEAGGTCANPALQKPSISKAKPHIRSAFPLFIQLILLVFQVPLRRKGISLSDRLIACPHRPAITTRVVTTSIPQRRLHWYIPAAAPSSATACTVLHCGMRSRSTTCPARLRTSNQPTPAWAA